MTTKITRKEYIESELAKWKEKYEIGFQDEFDLKAMLELQYQFTITPPEHVKTLGDIIHTKNQIMRNLNLKPAVSKENFEVLVFVNNNLQKAQVHDLFSRLLSGKLIEDELQVAMSGKVKGVLKSSNFNIRVETDSLNYYRGMRADYILNLTGNKEIDEYFRNQNKI